MRVTNISLSGSWLKISPEQLSVKESFSIKKLTILHWKSASTWLLYQRRVDSFTRTNYQWNVSWCHGDRWQSVCPCGGGGSGPSGAVSVTPSPPSCNPPHSSAYFYSSPAPCPHCWILNRRKFIINMIPLYWYKVSHTILHVYMLTKIMYIYLVSCSIVMPSTSYVKF